MRRTDATIVALAVALAAVAGCHATTTPPGQHAADERAILGAAALARGTKDNSGATPLPSSLVNVVDRLGAPSAEGSVIVADEAPALDSDVQAAIVNALSAYTVVWVHSLADVIGTGTSPPRSDTGVVLTLAEPHINGSAASVTSMLWCGNACGIGGTHTLERRNGIWVVSGTTGASYIA